MPFMRHRQGFTLVELLVAMALTVFVMVILSEAFVTGLETFSGLKGIGDMTEKLRAATTALRTDLAADHFEAKRRLSDADLYTNRPTCGFVRIFRGGATINEGNDADGISSFRSGSFAPVGGTTYGSHILHMTVKRRGSGRGDFFSASLPAGSPLLTASTTFFNQSADTRVQDGTNTYNSQWAEVAYVLVRTGSTTEPNVPTSTLGTPLYALYRLQRIVIADNSTVNFTAGSTVPGTAANRTAYAQLSVRPAGVAAGVLQFNTPSDLTTAANRAFNPAIPSFTPTSATNVGASLLMTNVVSFHVRVLPSLAPQSPTARRTTGTDLVEVGIAGVPTGTFDSDISTSVGGLAVPTFISAVGVTLRVWDQKTNQARQITVVQDM
jgi:prepilin-type N-terminal cleavage/methylation domain-containing protein